MTIGTIVISRNPFVEGRPSGVERTLQQGEGWLENTYRQSIRSEGGFWSASFSMLGNIDDLREFSRQALGAEVRVYTEEGELAWEGFIHSMELTLPGFSSLTSLENMANRVWVRYTTSTTGQQTGSSAQAYNAEAHARQMLFGGSGTLRSTKYDDLDSQARWGVKERVFSGGQMASAAVANSLAQQLLERIANPSRPNISMQTGGDESAAFVQVECRGWWDLLNWLVYTQTANTATELVSVQQGLITAGFPDLIKTEFINTNTLAVPQEHNADRKAGEILIDNARLGDSNGLRYNIGFKENRHLVYAPAAYDALGAISTKEVHYFSRASDPQRRIFSAGQSAIPFELVRPDKWLQVEDLYPFDTAVYPTFDENPSISYIEAVNFSEPNRLQVFSERGQMIDVLLAKSAQGNIGAG